MELSVLTIHIKGDAHVDVHHVIEGMWSKGWIRDWKADETAEPQMLVSLFATSLL